MPPRPSSNSNANMSSGREPIAIDLTLQGGGAHGGVHLGGNRADHRRGRPGHFKHYRHSRGAMNAVVLAHGVALDGEKGAKVALETFWPRVNGVAGFSPFQRTALDVMTGGPDRGDSDRKPVRIVLTITRWIACYASPAPLTVRYRRCHPVLAVGSSRIQAMPSLAEKAGVAFSTVHRFENTGSATGTTKDKIKAASPTATTLEPTCVSAVT